MTSIVYATTNPGKFAEVSKLFTGHHLSIHSAADYNIDIDVKETGSTLEENAILKVEAYLSAIKDDVIVVADDTGLEIDALGGEPGIKVRRWKGYKMTDEEIIQYCLKRMKGIKVKERGAQFRTVLAIAKQGKPTQLFSGIYRGTIRTKPLLTRESGFPFRSLLYNYHPTHRQKAVLAALPYLLSLRTSPN